GGGCDHGSPACEEEPLLRLLSSTDGLLRAFAGPRVRLRPLAVHGQAAAVPDPAVGADLGEPLDRLRALAPKVALDVEVLVDVVAELRDLLVGEVADLRVKGEPELTTDLPRGRGSDPVDVAQPNTEALLFP